MKKTASRSPARAALVAALRPALVARQRDSEQRVVATADAAGYRREAALQRRLDQEFCVTGALIERIRRRRLRAGDVALLRAFLGLSQPRFARALGISTRTLQGWEQQRVTPDGSGLALLRLAARYPQIIRELAEQPW